MLCQSVVVTGCNRGLGLEIVKQLSGCRSPPKHIIATYRDSGSATALLDLQKNNSHLKLLQLDVKNENTYESFKTKVEEIVGSDGLNLLINNAGMSSKSRELDLVTRAQMEETFLVNAIAPLMLTKALLPLLKLASSKSKDETMNVARAGVINVSSRLGSIEDNKTGNLYSYRSSKCALNAITKSLSIDLKPYNILVTSIHPGWVQTDMGGKGAPLTPSQSISHILKTLESLSGNDNGAFLQYDGKPIPW